MPCLGWFTPRKETRYPLNRRLGGPQGWSGWVAKILPPPEFKPWAVQPIMSCYTNCVIVATIDCMEHEESTRVTHKHVYTQYVY